MNLSSLTRRPSVGKCPLFQPAWVPPDRSLVCGHSLIARGCTSGLQPPARPSYDIATVNATYNNTIVTITKMDGSPINWASCGSVGFKVRRVDHPHRVPK